MKKHLLLATFITIAQCANAQLQSLMNTHSWAYQLQGIDIPTIASDNSFELIVMDYSADGTDEFKFTPAEISQVKASGKKAIVYISIGEAEDYRYYWQPSWNTTPPSWLGPENPDWAGNYKVRFWDPGWQSIVNAYVDTIIQQGFDGIYMDIVDAYYYWMVENSEKPYADTLMMNFVEKIRQHVDLVNGNSDFIMIPQNAEDIINSTNVTAGQKTRYFNAVNAVGVEDVFCYGDLDEDNPYSPDSYRIGELQEWLTADKQVFSIEYLTQSGLINQYLTGAATQDFVPYVCTRALDQLCPGISSGIEEENVLEIRNVYPNPSTGIINIELKPGLGIQSISVYSAIGTEIKYFSPFDLSGKDDQLKIDLSDQPANTYFIRIMSKRGTKLIIVQKV